MKDEHFIKLENMYRTAKSQQEMYADLDIDIQEDKTTISLPVISKYFHALNAMHGSVYFKLLDDATFFSVNAKVRDAFVLTTSFNINIIRPVNKGVIKAVGKVKYMSKNLFVAEGILYNEEGKEIAFGTGNFARSKIALEAVERYKL